MRCLMRSALRPLLPETRPDLREQSVPPAVHSGILPSSHLYSCPVLCLYIRLQLSEAYLYPPHLPAPVPFSPQGPHMHCSKPPGHCLHLPAPHLHLPEYLLLPAVRPGMFPSFHRCNRPVQLLHRYLQLPEVYLCLHPAPVPASLQALHMRCLTLSMPRSHQPAPHLRPPGHPLPPAAHPGIRSSSHLYNFPVLQLHKHLQLPEVRLYLPQLSQGRHKLSEARLSHCPQYSGQHSGWSVCFPHLSAHSGIQPSSDLYNCPALYLCMRYTVPEVRCSPPEECRRNGSRTLLRTDRSEQHRWFLRLR